jgi:uncharacterized membrane protein
MRVDLSVLLTILGMAAVTYGTRASGMWIAGRFELSGRVRAWLNALPGAILVSMVVPAVASGGPAAWLAALVTAGVAWRTRGLLPALVVGVGTVWALRAILPG